MAKITLNGTEFSLALRPIENGEEGVSAALTISLKNEFVHYENTRETLSRESLEEWMFSAFRLLAGAYGKEYNLSFEKVGFAVDFYPYTEDGREVERAERRRNDCVMAIRLLMRSEKENFLGGVYTLLLHRKDIEQFAVVLQAEIKSLFQPFDERTGEYLFVGVSPKGYKGCNYWYLDASNSVSEGDYVWVRMGRHNTEQIVYVDSVKYCSANTAPYDPATVKQVLRKATKDEIEPW